jgi:hypothetical protein
MTSRTRYLAGTVAALATTLAAMPFIGAGSASAAAGDFTGPAADGVDWYTGSTYSLSYEVASTLLVGPYAVTLWDLGASGATTDDVKLATVATGASMPTADKTFSWTIPTSLPKLIDSGLEIRLESTTTTKMFTDVTIANKIDVVQSTVGVPTTTSLTGGGTATVSWAPLGETGPTADINLIKTVDGKSTKVTLKKGVDNVTDDNSGTAGLQPSEVVNVPVSLTAGTGIYKIEVVPSNKAAQSGSSVATDGAVAAPTAPTLLQADGLTALGGAAKRNETINVVANGASAATAIDLVLRESTGSKKVVATIAKGVTDAGKRNALTIPVTLAPTEYEIAAIYSANKGAVAVTAITINNFATPASVTLSDSAGVSLGTSPNAKANQGQTVKIIWATTKLQKNTVVLIDSAGKETKLASGIATSASGAGVYYWVIPTTVKAGTGYTVKVINEQLKKADTGYASTASAVLEIVANQTKLG